jgi:hypothetical protein
MNTPQSLPAYADAALANPDTEELVKLLASDEDRVPRNVIDECARRVDTATLDDTLACLAAMAQDETGTRSPLFF